MILCFVVPHVFDLMLNFIPLEAKLGATIVHKYGDLNMESGVGGIECEAQLVSL